VLPRLDYSMHILVTSAAGIIVADLSQKSSAQRQFDNLNDYSQFALKLASLNEIKAGPLASGFTSLERVINRCTDGAKGKWRHDADLF
jgi:hypothetical protein